MSHRGRPVGRIALIGALLTLAMAHSAAGAAAAKPDRLYPVAESYFPGETATLVGYVNQATHGERRDLFIESLPIDAPNYPAEAVRIGVGTLQVSQTANTGRHRYRVFAEFVVPADLEPGVYRVVYDTDDGLVGELEASKLRVGVEPKRAVRRAWALDEPEIVNLSSDALIKVPGGTTTATEIREGSYFVDRGVVAPSRLGTRQLRIATPPEDIPFATLGLELPKVRLAVEAVSTGVDKSSANAGWILALAIVAFLVLIAADARDRRISAATRSGPPAD